VNPKRRNGAITGFVGANFKLEPGEVAAETALRDYPPPVSGTTPSLKLVLPVDKPAALGVIALAKCAADS